MEEALRSPALAGVVGEVDRLDLTAGRRLQLAAAAGGGWGSCLLRADRPPPRSAPPALRWRVGAGPDRSWHVELLRRRGGRPGAWILEREDETDRLLVAAELGDGSAAPQARLSPGKLRDNHRGARAAGSSSWRPMAPRRPRASCPASPWPMPGRSGLISLSSMPTAPAMRRRSHGSPIGAAAIRPWSPSTAPMGSGSTSPAAPISSAASAALMSDLRYRLAGFGHDARAAVADSPGAAWALARFREAEQTLRRAGDGARRFGAAAGGGTAPARRHGGGAGAPGPPAYRRSLSLAAGFAGPAFRHAAGASGWTRRWGASTSPSRPACRPRPLRCARCWRSRSSIARAWPPCCSACFPPLPRAGGRRAGRAAPGAAPAIASTAGWRSSRSAPAGRAATMPPWRGSSPRSWSASIPASASRPWCWPPRMSSLWPICSWPCARSRGGAGLGGRSGAPHRSPRQPPGLRPPRPGRAAGEPFPRTRGEAHAGGLPRHGREARRRRLAERQPARCACCRGPSR